jgi:hypothetical protein
MSLNIEGIAALSFLRKQESKDGARPGFPLEFTPYLIRGGNDRYWACAGMTGVRRF